MSDSPVCNWVLVIVEEGASQRVSDPLLLEPTLMMGQGFTFIYDRKLFSVCKQPNLCNMYDEFWGNFKRNWISCQRKEFVLILSEQWIVYCMRISLFLEESSQFRFTVLQNKESCWCTWFGNLSQRRPEGRARASDP